MCPKSPNPVPEMSESVDVSYIMGMGCVKSVDAEPMLIHSEALMSSAKMGLITCPQSWVAASMIANISAAQLP
jgi:hypothetical protein